MRCLECRFEFDEMNESQPVCPGCGAVPASRHCHLDLSGILDELPLIGMPEDTEVVADDGFDNDPVIDTGKLPIDLQEAADDAQALLEGTGLALFRLPGGGFRLFRVPIERVM